MNNHEMRVKGIAQKVEKELELDRIKQEQNAPLVIHEIRQGDLTSDCWLVQFRGLEACVECEYREKEDCGGGGTLLNLIGHLVKKRWGSLQTKFAPIDQNNIGRCIQAEKSFHDVITDNCKDVEGTFATELTAGRVKKVYRELIKAEELRINKEKRIGTSEYKPLDALYPYFDALRRGSIISKASWHKTGIVCHCEPDNERMKGAYRDVIMEIPDEHVKLFYYHQHCIVAEFDDRWILDSCGYHTATTLERMQRYARPLRIHQAHQNWWGYDYNNELFELIDGITIPKPKETQTP